ncbi:MAG: putative transposase, partial [bacterium]
FISQLVVVKSIKAILKYKFIDFGYQLITKYLNRDGTLINHKKTISNHERRRSFKTQE